MLVLRATTPCSHHRHQASPKGLLDLSPPPSLSSNQRRHARRRFYQIIDHFDVDDGQAGQIRGTSYNRPRLVRLTYEYALAEESRALFLQAFFRSVQLPIDDEEDVVFENIEQRIQSDVLGFAEYLIDNFF